jgi:hypothetical protein
MRISPDGKNTQLTLGDLIVAVTDAAMEVSKDDKVAYRIACMALSTMRLRSLSQDDTAELDFPEWSRTH